MRALRLIMIMMSAVFLSACATPNFLVVSGGKTEYKIPINPAVQLGVEATKTIQSSDFLVVEALFPATLSGEIRDLRRRWPAFAVGVDRQGKITDAYPAQAIFMGYRGCEDPVRVFHVFIEGAKSHPSYDMKIITASTLVTKLYGLDGLGPISADTDKEFLNDESYRNATVAFVGTSFNEWVKNGHQIDERNYSNKIFPAMHIFDVFKDSKEALPIITSFDRNQIDAVASKNPGYTFVERARRDATWASISPNPYTIASTILFGLMIDGASPSSGWDEKSVTTGEELQSAFDYDTALRAASKEDCKVLRESE